MNIAQPLFQFHNVSVRFNDSTVIDNISFNVFKGEKCLIYGKSGIGKTTFFRLLLGFEEIQEGYILYKGEPVNDRSIWTIRKQVAYVSQDLDVGGGPVHLMIKTLFSYGHTRSFSDHTTKLMELLEFLNLDEKILMEEYEKLSGGEKQRIMLTIALLLRRDIFLLDEVTSSLDRELKNKVIRYFVENPAWTVLSISHDRDWLKRKEFKVIKIGS